MTSGGEPHLVRQEGEENMTMQEASHFRGTIFADPLYKSNCFCYTHTQASFHFPSEQLWETLNNIHNFQLSSCRAGAALPATSGSPAPSSVPGKRVLNHYLWQEGKEQTVRATVRSLCGWRSSPYFHSFMLWAIYSS